MGDGVEATGTTEGATRVVGGAIVRAAVGALSAAAVRVPPARGIRAGLVLIAAATLGMGVEQRLAGWIVLRWLAGVASAWVLIGVSASCLARLNPLGRPALNGAVFAVAFALYWFLGGREDE